MLNEEGAMVVSAPNMPNLSVPPIVGGTDDLEDVLVRLLLHWDLLTAVHRFGMKLSKGDMFQRSGRLVLDDSCSKTLQRQMVL